MRTIVHLSDLHFGRIEEELIPSLLQIIQNKRPDLIIISGDFTQRATKHQFEQAQNFLSQLPGKIIAAPGNHDIPLYNLWRRFTNPYKNYKEYISEDLEPHYLDQELAIKVINSVRATKRIEGRINSYQLRQTKDFFSQVSKNILKIVVTHHPFNVPINYPGKPLTRAHIALKQFQETGVDLLLSGHLHNTLGHLKITANKIPGTTPLIIRAGTAFSTRLRTEPNSFNILKVDLPKLSIERYQRDPNQISFLLTRTENYFKEAGGFKAID
ncbi:MAG TPA: metallophosphoesterase [Methylomirabilota bacterium]|jgi:3',5'-cyclic AMP phosphodiesterase CpdA|nr:metallophosphoesterase [Methylomirabilota bacterium]